MRASDLRVLGLGATVLTGLLGLQGQAQADPIPSQTPSFDILRPEAGSVVRHPWVIVEGHAPGDTVVLGTDRSPKGPALPGNRFPVVNGKFLGVVALQPGKQMILAKFGSRTVKSRIDYVPMKTAYKVTCVYLVARDEQPTFEGLQGEDSQREIKSRVRTAVRLLQAFTADAMQRSGFGNKTFHVEEQENGEPVVQFITLDQDGADLRKKDMNAFWGEAYGLLGKDFVFENTKLLCLNGFAKYDPATKRAGGHTALGGGSLAMFGTLGMRYWPRSIAEVSKAFTDKMEVNGVDRFDDSAYRKAAWANAATTYGAMIHELGHTFGLPHTNDPNCVMSRGFDHINRCFLAVEPAGDKGISPFGDPPALRTTWDPFFATRLSYHPFFQADGPLAPSLPGPTIQRTATEIIITAPAGIRVYGGWKDGKPNFFTHVQEKELATLLKFRPSDWFEKIGDQDLEVYVMDKAGREANLNIKRTP